MTLRAASRKLALTIHVVMSIGWLGAVVAFLALAIGGLAGQNAETVRAAYISMAVIYSFVVLPLGIASSLSGIVLSVGSDWGFFRHYWLIIKEVMIVPLTLLMVVHRGPLQVAVDAASRGVLLPTDLHGLRLELTIDSIMAVIALMVATVLSIYKPRGRTGLGTLTLYRDQTS